MLAVLSHYSDCNPFIVYSQDALNLAGLDHVLDKTSKPIPEERSHQDDPLSENLAHAQNHSPQNERSQTVREALTNPKTANLEVNDSEKAEEQLNSKKRPSSAAGKEMKRLTEAQRLMTLWAGDK